MNAYTCPHCGEPTLGCNQANEHLRQCEKNPGRDFFWCTTHARKTEDEDGGTSCHIVKISPTDMGIKNWGTPITGRTQSRDENRSSIVCPHCKESVADGDADLHLETCLMRPGDWWCSVHRARPVVDLATGRRKCSGKSFTPCKIHHLECRETDDPNWLDETQQHLAHTAKALGVEVPSVDTMSRDDWTKLAADTLVAAKLMAGRPARQSTCYPFIYELLEKGYEINLRPDINGVTTLTVQEAKNGNVDVYEIALDPMEWMFCEEGIAERLKEIRDTIAEHI